MVRWVIGIVLMSAALAQQLPDVKTPRAAPPQPIAYSHKLHAGTLKLPCAGCHPIPGEGDYATIPQAAKCMTCHQTIKKDSPEIAKIAAAKAENKEIEWARVYKIPDYVSFNHKQHMAVEGVACENCHGPVKESVALRREKDISMAACLECHRAKGASINCVLCHDAK